jgi:hypothetical protein
VAEACIAHASIRQCLLEELGHPPSREGPPWVRSSVAATGASNTLRYRPKRRRKWSPSSKGTGHAPKESRTHRQRHSTRPAQPRMIGGTSGDATGRWDPVSIAVPIDPLRANRIPCDRAVLCALVLLTGCDIVGLHEPIIVLLLKSGEDVLAHASIHECTLRNAVAFLDPGMCHGRGQPLRRSLR